MSDMTADEMVQRIIRSFKENSDLLERTRRAEKFGRIERNVLAVLLFISGLVLGTLPVTDRILANIANVTAWVGSTISRH